MPYRTLALLWANTSQLRVSSLAAFYHKSIAATIAKAFSTDLAKYVLSSENPAMAAKVRIGAELFCAPDLRQALDAARQDGLDFACSPLSHPRNARDARGVTDEALRTVASLERTIASLEAQPRRASSSALGSFSELSGLDDTPSRSFSENPVNPLFDEDDLAIMDEMYQEALSPTVTRGGGRADSRDFDDDEPPAWELPAHMLTGGMPANFEQTRRAVGDLTEQLAEKKDKIELLLEL